MIDRRQPGSHPDADRLSAFMEGALSEHEREECLAHLAECTECRDIVFLAQQAVPPPLRVPAALPAWRRWLQPLPLAAAAIACGLIVMLWMRPHPAPRPVSSQVAVAHPAAPPLPPSAATATPEPAPEQPASPRKEFASKKPALTVPAIDAPAAAPSGVLGGLMAGVPAQSPRPAAQQASPVVAGRAQAALSTSGAAAGLATAPATGSATAAQQSDGLLAAKNANPAIQAGPVELQSERRLFAAGRAVNGLLGAPNPLHLTIEHNQGPDNGFSAIRGAVTDPAGAVVANASITLRKASGEVASTATTDPQGRFTLPAVVPGQYRLLITAPGFRADSERLDLQARDLAQLSPVLEVGAASQTVTVTVANQTLALSSNSDNAQLSAIVPVLPGKVPSISSIVSNGRILALDAAGRLYLSRDAGRHWKKIRAVWSGSVAHLGPATEAESSTDMKARSAGVPAVPPIFELTTTDGAIWISSDGAHWHLR
jgi:hypothetical protein